MLFLDGLQENSLASNAIAILGWREVKVHVAVAPQRGAIHDRGKQSIT